MWGCRGRVGHRYGCEFHILENSNWRSKDTVPIGLENAGGRASLLARAAESSHRHRSQENAEIPEVRPAPLPAPGPWGSEPAGTPVKNSCVAPGPWEHVCYAEPLGAKKGQGDAHLPRLLS